MSDRQILLLVAGGVGAWFLVGHIVAIAVALFVDDADDPVLLVGMTVLWPFVLLFCGVAVWGLLMLICVEKIKRLIERLKP